VRGIAGAQRELARRRRDQFDDVFRIEPHDQVVDSASGRRHQLSCAGVQHPHPAVGEQPQRGATNLLDRVVGDHAHRLERIRDCPPAHRLRCAGG
jgi:hypothetical protein